MQIDRDRKDLVIIGGGVTGCALAYVMSTYTNVKDIAIIEKNPWVAQVNSHPLNNAQTSHDGGTETGYPLDDALKVRQAAMILRRYVTMRDDPLLFRKTHRMVLGVVEQEVEKLHQRFEEFKGYYPDLRFVEAKELGGLEPMVMKGRNSRETVAALVSTEGYAINYQRLAECLLADAKNINKFLEIRFSTRVKDIRRSSEQYIVETDHGAIYAHTVVCAAGAYSLLFAQMLGFGMEYAILPVAGSFYSAGRVLNGKVYRPQVKGRPFAEIHGDPDILNQYDTRFGPTTKPLPLMERHRYKTFFDFMKLPLISLRGAQSLYQILVDNGLVGYVGKNMVYDVPVIGKLCFFEEVKKIVPSIRYGDLKLRRGAGGIRPQIIDLKTGKLKMGDATIVEDNIIFNTTPSPGASVCLGNAKRDAAKIVAFLGSSGYFDKDAFERDLG